MTDTQTPAMRECGDCSACCEGHLVGFAFRHTFGNGRPCVKLQQHDGRSICTARRERPSSCVNYFCMWAQSAIDEQYRPDLSGWLFSTQIDDQRRQYIKGLQIREDADQGALDAMQEFARQNGSYVTIVTWEQMQQQSAQRIRERIVQEHLPVTPTPTQYMRLNLGCGRVILPGYINIDHTPMTVYPECYPYTEVQYLDLKEPLPFSDNWVDEVRAHHILEHIDGDGFFNLLKELYRVCRHGAQIHVVVPHPRHDVFLGDPTHVRPITLEMMQRFSKRQCLGDIAAGSTMTPFALLLDVDFEITHHNYLLDPCMTHITSDPNDPMLDTYARIYNNVVQEIHFTMEVKK